MARAPARASVAALAHAVLTACRDRGRMIATAESCTGGRVAAALTAIAGSSDAFDRGFVTYSNGAKEQMLGVRAATLRRHGAVSSETASEMAKGALKHSAATLAVSITGIAGPGGGAPGKPVGLVHFAVARKDGVMMLLERRYGAKGRAAIQRLATQDALTLLLALAAPEERVTPKRVTPGRKRRPPASRTPQRSAGTRRRTSRP